MEWIKEMILYLISINVEYNYHDNGLWLFINNWEIEEFFSFTDNEYFDDDGYRIYWKGSYLVVDILSLMEHYGQFELYKHLFPINGSYIKGGVNEQD